MMEFSSHCLLILLYVILITSQCRAEEKATRDDCNPVERLLLFPLNVPPCEPLRIWEVAWSKWDEANPIYWTTEVLINSVTMGQKLAMDFVLEALSIPLVALKRNVSSTLVNRIMMSFTDHRLLSSISFLGSLDYYKLGGILALFLAPLFWRIVLGQDPRPVTKATLEVPTTLCDTCRQLVDSEIKSDQKKNNLNIFPRANLNKLYNLRSTRTDDGHQTAVTTPMAINPKHHATDPRKDQVCLPPTGQTWLTLTQASPQYTTAKSSPQTPVDLANEEVSRLSDFIKDLHEISKQSSMRKASTPIEFSPGRGMTRTFQLSPMIGQKNDKNSSSASPCLADPVTIKGQLSPKGCCSKCSLQTANTDTPMISAEPSPRGDTHQSGFVKSNDAVIVVTLPSPPNYSPKHSWQTAETDSPIVSAEPSPCPRYGVCHPSPTNKEIFMFNRLPSPKSSSSKNSWRTAEANSPISAKISPCTGFDICQSSPISSSDTITSNILSSRKRHSPKNSWQTADSDTPMISAEPSPCRGYGVRHSSPITSTDTPQIVDALNDSYDGNNGSSSGAGSSINEDSFVSLPSKVIVDDTGKCVTKFSPVMCVISKRSPDKTERGFSFHSEDSLLCSYSSVYSNEDSQLTEGDSSLLDISGLNKSLISYTNNGQAVPELVTVWLFRKLITKFQTLFPSEEHSI